MLNKTIIDLWHISRTALANQDTSRYSRMIYIKQELLRSYPALVEGMSNKQIWFAIEDAIN
jgi:hypothetical protein